MQGIQLLQELFAEEVSKVDQGFFLRLKESGFYPEDKILNQTDTLFSDDDFTDKEYNKKYPTIYHLRKALIDGGRDFDVRLVYLALHHIIKKRGHFLFQGQNMESVPSFQNVFEALVSYLQDEFQVDLYCQSIDDVELILKDKSIGVNEKKKQLTKLIQVSTKQEKVVLSLMVGATVKSSELFEDSSLDEGEITKVCFSSGKSLLYQQKQFVMVYTAEIISYISIYYAQCTTLVSNSDILSIACFALRFGRKPYEQV